MKRWKLITLISSLVLVIAVAVTLIIIFNYKKKDSVDYTYPSVIPEISNADESFFKVGSRDISNLEMYNMTIVSYGLSSLVDLMDQKIFDLSTVTLDEITEKKISLYASANGIEKEEVDFNNEEQTRIFQKQMALQGCMDEETIEKAIKLDIVRNKYAKEQLLKEIKEYTATENDPHFFSINQLNNASSELDEFKTTIKTIVLSFRSESEAVKLLKEFGVSTSNLNNGWKTEEGTPFTKEQIIDTYISMYNYINNKEYTIDDFPYVSATELSKISSVISNVVFNNYEDIDETIDLKKSYTYNPNKKSYLSNYYYLALRIDTNKPFDSDEFFAELDKFEISEKYQALFDKLVDNYLTTTYINKVLYQLRCEQKPKIYDERLDYGFSNQVVASLGDNHYTLTTDESKEIICEFNNKKITADELFQYMMANYGPIVSLQFVNFYILFNDTYSTIYNFETKTRLADYDASYEESINSLKKSLENGELEQYGYSRYYGFDNFLRDYGGLTYKDDAICLGSAYSLALSSYSGSRAYATSAATDELYAKFNQAYITKDITLSSFLNYFNNLDGEIKNSVVYQIIDNFNQFFSIKALSITYFKDTVGDANGEELTVEERSKAELLVNAVIYLAKNNPTNLSPSTDPVINLASRILTAVKAGKYRPYNDFNLSTVENRIDRLLLIYNVSPINDEVFGEFKQLNIRISNNGETTYVNNNATDEIKPVFRTLWLKILDGELLLDNGKYAYFERTKVINPPSTALKAVGITSSTPYYLMNGIEKNYKTTKYIITEVVNTTWYQFYEGEDKIITELIPANQRLDCLTIYYAISLIESAKRTQQQQKAYDDNAPVDFETPYVTNIVGPAYDKIVDSDLINKVLNNARAKLVENDTVYFNDNRFKEHCVLIMQLLSE